MKHVTSFVAAVAALVAVGTTGTLDAKEVLRVGYFPNVTHGQGVIGAAGTRAGDGWFEAALGPDVELQWFSFNAGPSAMEAIFAGSIDLTYVGPNPALNAYIRSGGDEIRVLAGATLGGAALVVRTESGIAKAEDFRGRRLGTPQLGNTQDVAARAWLKQQGFRISVTGGDVLVVPTANPDQLSLFQTEKLDAVWTVEPWVSRLVLEGGGRIYLEQPEAVTTLLVSSVRLLRERPELAQRFRDAHVALTGWICDHPEEAREKVRLALSAEMRREMPTTLIEAAWPRLHFDTALEASALESFVRDAQAAGFLRDAVPLDRMFSLKP